jgi:hypothetical protein
LSVPGVGERSQERSVRLLKREVGVMCASAVKVAAGQGIGDVVVAAWNVLHA